MNVFLRYFAFVAAAITFFNLVQLSRSVERSGPGRGMSPAQCAQAKSVLRVWFGSIGAFLALTGVVQLVRGYPTFFFMFASRPTDPAVIGLWVLMYLVWIALLVMLWRPGVPEVVARLGLVRGAQCSPSTLRMVLTAGMLINATVFALLLLGVWRMPPLPL